MPASMNQTVLVTISRIGSSQTWRILSLLGPPYRSFTVTCESQGTNSGRTFENRINRSYVDDISHLPLAILP
jgi:hypothetical protein